MRIECYTGPGFGENAYLIHTGDRGALVVDPGSGTPQMVEEILRQGLEVEAILLTHAHLDHIEGIPTIRAVTQAPIYLHDADRFLYDMAPQQGAAFGLPVPDLPPPDLPLKAGESIRFGSVEFDVRFTPGHAPGHVILICREAGLALVGDVVFQGSIGRTDLPGGDYEVLMDSIRDEVLTLPDETRLLCGHGPETTVGLERQGNPFLVPHDSGDFA